MIEVYIANMENVWCGVAYENDRIYATTFASTQENALRGLQQSIPASLGATQQTQNPPAFVKHATLALQDSVNGKETKEDMVFAMDHLTDYTRRVLQTCLLVPLGYVTSYGSLAKAAGGSPRAAGHVMATNPFAPIVPCHRVVASDLTLGGYGGGLAMKLEMLKRESRGYSSPRDIPVGNKKLRVFPVEFVLRKAKKG
jgi:O-6-methylguanine DNA methyltransferase